MRPFYHDHPLRATPPGAMSCDELRFWIKHLLKTPGTPWGPQALGLALGCGGKGYDSASKNVSAKINEKTRVWIYPSEQLRFSRQLPKVLAGLLEPAKVGRHRKSAVRVAENPKPMKLPASRWRYDLSSGKLKHHPFRMMTFRDTLPGFNAVMGTERWNGHWDD